jgi:hypothetical protein
MGFIVGSKYEQDALGVITPVAAPVAHLLFLLAGQS